MNTSAKIGGLLAAIMLAASGSAMAAEPVNPYVTSSDGKVVMDPFGLCWRTGFWTPALAEALGYNGAGCQCDKEILSKAACTAPLLLRLRPRLPLRPLSLLLRPRRR